MGAQADGTAGLPVVLRGQLADFGLADLLGLFVFGERDGIVLLHWLGRQGAVWVASGKVIAACSDLQSPQFLRRVAVTSRLGVGPVKEVLAEPAPVAALVAAGEIDVRTARDVGSDVIVDAIAELLRWDDGLFELTLEPGVPDDVGIRLDVAGLLGEARRRAEQWASIADGLPDPDAVLALRAAAADTVSLSPQMWQVAALIDGRRTVGEVLAACGSPLVAGPGLAALLDQGLADVVEPTRGMDEVLEVLAEAGQDRWAADLPLPRSGNRIPEPSLDRPETGLPQADNPDADSAVPGNWTAPRRRGSHAAGPVPDVPPTRRENPPARIPGPAAVRGGRRAAQAVAQEAEVPDVDGLSRSLLMQLIAGVRGL